MNKFNKFDRFKNTNRYCEHMQPVIDIFRYDTRVDNNIRIVPKYGRYTILQCKLCKTETNANECIQFWIDSELVEAKQILKEIDEEKVNEAKVKGKTSTSDLGENL